MPRSFADRLIAWQRANGRRDLPWQGTRDPYRIWLSEVMLQQTRVATVVPYYRRFLDTFPDIGSLAAAPVGRVLELWSGLGYYSRGRNLHAAAVAVVERHGGRFPEHADEISALPGIGRSTAAAICVFAFGSRLAILDGNVKRVLARYRGVEGYPGRGDVERSLWRIAESLLPAAGNATPIFGIVRMSGRPGDDEGAGPTAIGVAATAASRIADYTQGLMDLGATVCTKHPDCARCPVRPDCFAHAAGRIAEIPAPRPKRALPHRETGVLLIEWTGHVLLERRPPHGVWGGLWTLPEVALPESPTAEWIYELCAQHFHCAATSVEFLPPLRHAFTHFTLTLRPVRLRIEARPPATAYPPGHLWLSLQDVPGAALPTPIKRLLGAVV